MILIKNIEVVDGTGKPPYAADVLLKGERISAIGKFSGKTAELTIDGSGKQLTPGFIDLNTDSDHYLTLFTHPSQRDFLLQGVTTIIGGHCGSSLAPLIYGSLESIRKWADVNQINVDWHTVSELFSTLERRKLGVNFGTLIGHSTVRRALIGESFRDLTANELAVMKSVAEGALSEGALGVSTGLGYAHARQTPYFEIRTLAEAAARRGAVYSTHLRDEREGLLSSISETVRIAEETKVKTVISHFRPLLGFEKDFESALAVLEKLPRETDVRFDSYPFDTSIVPIYTLLPRWAQNGGLEVMLANIKTPYLRDRILSELPEAGGDLRVAQAPAADFLVGKTLGEFSANQEVNHREGLLRLMLATNLRAVVLYKNINLELAIKSLFSERGLVASNSPSLAEAIAVVKHERAYNTFPKFLSLVRERKVMPLEKAIQKITAVPAALFDLKDRGEVREGVIADLVMFRDGKVENVFVSGEMAVKDGVFQNILAGKIIKRG